MNTDAPPITPEEAERFLPEALRRPPIFDLLNATPAGQRQLQLIRTRVARGATDSEVAQFLELCAQYGLDWNADEAWCAVSNPDNPEKRRVLLMVGRNGLRKIAQRQGLDFDGDVVRANDHFKVTRNADRTRTVEHVYEEGADDEVRGPLRGAWCECFEVATGRQRGYFYARVIEYKPKSERALQFSPWGAQESVMMLTAAERQALGQATPLGGIVGTGELDRNNELAAEANLTLGSGEPSDVELPPEVEEVVGRARELGHAGLANANAAVMETSGLDVAEWVARSHKMLDEFECAKAAAVIDTDTAPPMDPPEAEVVAEAIAANEDLPRVIAELTATANRYEQEGEDAKAAGRHEEASVLLDEAASIREQIAAMQGQEELPL